MSLGAMSKDTKTISNLIIEILEFTVEIKLFQTLLSWAPPGLLDLEKGKKLFFEKKKSIHLS